MVEAIFTDEHVEKMRPHIQQIVDDLLSTILKDGGSAPFDLVEKFALPVPSYVGFPCLLCIAPILMTERQFMAFSEFH